ncbi:MAG: alpha/beta hydrolase [Sphaerochaetaceae bacterium]|nr:alpha/beta hydrolase [Sphaerochaetaceae bacterium]
MHIARQMINPELRARGTLIRFFWPSFSLRKFRFCNAVLDKFGKDHAFSKSFSYEQVYIPRNDGSLLRLCVYTPKNAIPERRHTPVPGLLWLHGGGYAIGIPEQDYLFIERFIEASDCVVVSPDYTRSVDAPYPAALDDCYLALRWLKEHWIDYGVRSDQLFVGGDSAGGGLAAALCLYARDKGEISIAFQMPLYPMLDDRPTGSSLSNDAPVWNTVSNDLAWKLYLGELFGTEHVPKYAAPARETDYAGLPPTLTFVGSVEPFRDETIQYVEMLRDAGVETAFQVYDGCFHAFELVGRRTDIGRQAIEFLISGFKHAVATYRKAQPDGDT